MRSVELAMKYVMVTCITHGDGIGGIGREVENWMVGREGKRLGEGIEGPETFHIHLPVGSYLGAFFFI